MRKQGTISKQTFLIILFLIIRIFLFGQNYVQIPDSFDTKKLNVEIHIDKKVTQREIEPYIAFNYDFGDSVSIYKNGKEIFRTQLVYQRPDSNSTLFPYTRKLIRLQRMKNSNKLNYVNCQVIFWKSKKVIEFYFHKNAMYYVLGLDKDLLKWDLYVSNAFPWPD